MKVLEGAAIVYCFSRLLNCIVGIGDETEQIICEGYIEYDTVVNRTLFPGEGCKAEFGKGLCIDGFGTWILCVVKTVSGGIDVASISLIGAKAL